MNNDTFIVWHDSLSGEPNIVECLSYESIQKSNAIDDLTDSPEKLGKNNRQDTNRPPLAAGDFVLVKDSDQNTTWMAQVVEPQRNLPLQGLSRESPSAVAVFERILRGDISKSIFLNQVYYYRLQLIGEVTTNGRLTSVRRRPRAGSVGHAASEESVRRALDLPAIYRNKNDQNNVLGRIHSSSIPVAVDWQAFKQHILVAGATGSGKSNTVANLIKAGQAYGACIIIYDQKPDYQHITNPNDENHLFINWNSNIIKPFALSNASKYALYQGDEKEPDEQLIAIRARDVSRDMLVEVLYPYPDEGNQRDLFGALLNHYASNNQTWTLVKFKQWVTEGRRDGSLARLAQTQGWGELNEKNVDATLRKMDIRRMKWLDALENRVRPTAPGGIFDKNTSSGKEPTGYFEPRKYIGPGKILVIRTNASGREYGVFLTYMLREVFDLTRDKKVKCPVVNIVDEAQDIFQSGQASSMATSKMNEIIRKGRSKDIAFVIAAQSVSQIPDSVLTNMNTRLIHRQNSVEELRKAIPSAPKELMSNSLTFGPGEALVSIIGARSVIHSEMAPSPFELTKLSAAARQTLADQIEDTENNAKELNPA
jgi:hypothetical protein